MSDYDVIVVGSGFGGGVAALRAAEKGYKVGVMEAGKRWNAEDYPKTNWDIPEFMWFPALGMYGLMRLEAIDDEFIFASAGVGGGSNIYGNALYVPGKEFFESDDWSDITDWADELAPYIDLAERMMGVDRTGHYMPNDFARAMYTTAKHFGREDTFQPSPCGVYFGKPGVEVDDPYFGGKGPRRTGCISCSKCMVGCAYGAKNTIQLNYLYLAESLGAVVHPLHEVHEIKALDGGGFEVHTRHPGWLQRAVNDKAEKTYTADQVIVAAHAFGTAKLLLSNQHNGNLAGMSSMAGHRARTNDEEMIYLTIPYDDWKKDPNRIIQSKGSLSERGSVWIDDATSIQPNSYGPGNNVMAAGITYLQEGPQDHPIEEWLKTLVTHPEKILRNIDMRNWSERTTILVAMQTGDNWLDLSWDGDKVRSKLGHGSADRAHVPQIEEFAAKMAEVMGTYRGGLVFQLFNRGGTAHFVGGMPIAETAEKGAIDPYQRVFGVPGLHVMDGAVMPANPGVNPTLMLTSLAERAMSFWPNKGDDDQRPSLGSGYKRIDAVMPHKPLVPKGAHGEYRLDVKPDQIIPKSATRPDILIGKK